MKKLKQCMRPWAQIILLGMAVGCTTVPETGRTQFNILSESEEMQLGVASFQELKKDVPISQNASANALLQEVGRKIAAVADLPNAKWEFVLFESEEPNAFCLPGGKVGIYTGILPITQNEAGLATVIGHEVAHAVARHGGERMTHQMALQTTGSVIDASLGTVKPEWQAVTSTAFGLGAQLGLALPHSRKQESEADYIGLLYMARAGYPPEEAVDFWRRFQAFNQQSGAGAAPWFLRTHPLDADRIEQIQSWIPEARREMRSAPRNR